MKTILYISVFLLGSASLHAQIYGVGNGGGFAKAVKGGPGTELALPISLLNFSAKHKENNVHLTWQTASEQNNDFFTLEKSQDAQNWLPFFDTLGAGNSNVLLSYSHTHKNPYEGYNYYRLKQTDYNGAYTYSNIIDVQFNKATSPISIYPNPAQDKLFIEGLNQSASIQLYNSLGAQVPVMVLYEGEMKILDVSGIPKGVYLIQGEGLMEKFIKE